MDTEDDEIVQIIREADDPVVGTRYVADHLGYSIQGTKDRLDQLVEEGILGTAKVGRVNVFWLVERFNADD